MSSHVIVGRVRNVHGLRGELVVESHTDAPDAVFASGRRLFAGTIRGILQPQPLVIQSVRPFKGGWIVKFEGIDDRNTAEMSRERFLFLEASEVEPLEEGEVYIHELDGMQVRLEAGEVIGRVTATYELPQGLMLDVAREGKGAVLIPYDRVVTSVDREQRVILVDPPEGLLD